MKNNSFNIDSFINNKELNILKAVLPFLPSGTQKFMAIYIAIRELSNIFALLNSLNNSSFAVSSDNNSELDITKILEAVKKFLDPSESEMIDNYMNIMEMMMVMNSMNENEDAGMDILKNMLTPEQSAIFESFNTDN